MSRQRGILDRDAAASKYSRADVIASYDFCIAALEEQRASFESSIAVLKTHRAKMLPECAHEWAGYRDASHMICTVCKTVKEEVHQLNTGE